MRIRAKANNKSGHTYLLARNVLSAGSMKFDSSGHLHISTTGQDDDFRKGEYRYTVILDQNELEMIVALSTVAELRQRIEALERLVNDR